MSKSKNVLEVAAPEARAHDAATHPLVVQIVSLGHTRVLHAAACRAGQNAVPRRLRQVHHAHPQGPAGLRMKAAVFGLFRVLELCRQVLKEFPQEGALITFTQL